LIVKAKAKLKYGFVIGWSPEDDAYVVRVPELPGCMTHGDTPEIALKRAQEGGLALVDDSII
jgi:predicted RNase H-like HicB family nuclease